MTAFAGIMLFFLGCAICVAGEFPFPVGIDLQVFRYNVSASIQIYSMFNIRQSNLFLFAKYNTPNACCISRYILHNTTIFCYNIVII